VARDSERGLKSLEAARAQKTFARPSALTSGGQQWRPFQAQPVSQGDRMIMVRENCIGPRAPAPAEQLQQI